MGGMIEPLDLVRKDIIVPHNFVFASNGNEPNFNLNFDPGITIETYSVDFEQKSPAYFIDGAYIEATAEYKTTNKTNGKFEINSLYNDHQLVLRNITETGSGFFSFGLAGNSTYSSDVATQFNITRVDYTAKFLFPIKVSIYNQIKLTNEIKTNHTITFTKTGKDDEKLPGAVYELYQELPDGDVLKDTYTTGPDGTFTVPADVLSNGTFYLLEKTAPAGYAVNPEKVYVNLTGGTVEVTSDTGNTITTNDGQTQKTESIDGNGTFALGGFYTDEEGVEHYNDDIQLKVTPPEGGALKTLTVHRTAGKGTEATKTFTAAEVENGTALTYIKDAVKEYANVEVSAEFEMNVVAAQSDKPSSSFKITKEVKGGEAEKPFEFTVELTNSDNTAYKGSYTLNGVVQTYTVPFTVSVAAGDETVIGGLPVDTKYKVTEAKTTGWTAEQESISGVTQADKVTGGQAEPATSADFVNRRIPKLSYVMEKNRVTPAKLKPGTTDKYGFENGDIVEYAVTIQNTGECDLTMDVTDRFTDEDKFTDVKVTKVDGAAKNSDIADKVGVNITVKAGETATITFSAVVATDVEILSGTAADDGKGYENIAETSNVKGTYTDDEGNETVYSPEPVDGEEQYPDNPDGANPLDPQEDTATTPVYKADEEQPPVEPEEPTDPEPSNPDNPNQPTDPSQPENPGTPDDNPENPDEPGKPDIPQTGDESNPALYFALMGAGLIGLAASLFLKKK